MSFSIEETVIVTSFDENYYNYACVPVKTLGQNYSGNEKLHVRCLVPESLVEKQEKFINIVDEDLLDIKFICSDSYLSLVEEGLAYESKYITENMSHRLFVGSTFEEYKKIIYIDPDTLVVRDIEPLLNYPLTNKFLAVVEYTGMSKEVFGNPDLPYFNNGVFIADLDFWRSESLELKFVKWLKENGPTPCPEQDAMNAVLQGEWSPLPMTFNLLVFKLLEDSEFQKNFDNPLIVHFVGDLKPWGDSDIPIWTKKWREIYNQLNLSLPPQGENDKDDS